MRRKAKGPVTVVRRVLPRKLSPGPCQNIELAQGLNRNLRVNATDRHMIVGVLEMRVLAMLTIQTGAWQLTVS